MARLAERREQNPLTDTRAPERAACHVNERLWHRCCRPNSKHPSYGYTSNDSWP